MVVGAAEVNKPASNSTPKEDSVVELELHEIARTERRKQWPVLQNLNLPYQYTDPEPRVTTLTQHYRNHAGIVELHLLLPERVHEMLLIKRFCGSRSAAIELNDTYSVRYWIEFWVLVMFNITTVASIATLGYTLSIEESVPDWFPVVGAVFYIVGLPTLILTLVNRIDSYIFMAHIDDKTLKPTMIAIALVCFACSPVYGMWAVTNLPENATVVENMGLYVGAYVGLALYLPMWVFLVYCVLLYLDSGRRSDTLNLRVSTFIAVGIAGFLVGSVVHQAVVQELLWFPYLGAIGILFHIPIVCVSCIALAIRAVINIFQLSGFKPAVIEFIMWLFFMGITDIFAWKLAERNLNQPLEQLIADQFLYIGAIFVFVMSILILFLSIWHALHYNNWLE